MENFTIQEIRHKLTPSQQLFFENLSKYVDKPLFFYGSIYRNDYIPGKSDIDVIIFTDNEASSTELMGSFLNAKKADIKKTIIKINNIIIHGYKTRYNDPENNIDTEISIYNEKYKKIILDDYALGRHLPIHISVILFVIKYLFYNLNVLSKSTYKRCKQFLMNSGDEMKFIQL